MEGADQVLLTKGVDRGLAADRAVGLGEQGRGKVDDRAAALEQRGGEPGEVADAAAAERDDRRVAGGAALGKPGEKLMQAGPILGRLALGHKDRIGAERVGDGRAVQGENPRLADQDRRVPAREVADSLEPGFDRTDEHVISAGRQCRPG